MAENKLADMSTEFAVKILNLTDGIKGQTLFFSQPTRKKRHKYRRKHQRG